ncbi:hypothetical protein [Streptomyces sp. 2A115]|uniref:hypothetical protein n=1 Tax=Streptomyces sp. 2A115 TaxID=3457439 RepID=UPI003FD20EC9
MPDIINVMRGQGMAGDLLAPHLVPSRGHFGTTVPEVRALMDANELLPPRL